MQIGGGQFEKRILTSIPLCSSSSYFIYSWLVRFLMF